MNFFTDMGSCPSRCSLERKNTNGDYKPSNCRWATQKEQQNNRTNNHRIEFQGQIKTISGWAEHLGISRSRIKYRLHASKKLDDVFFVGLLRPRIVQSPLKQPSLL